MFFQYISLQLTVKITVEHYGIFTIFATEIILPAV